MPHGEGSINLAATYPLWRKLNGSRLFSPAAYQRVVTIELSGAASSSDDTRLRLGLLNKEIPRKNFAQAMP